MRAIKEQRDYWEQRAATGSDLEAIGVSSDHPQFDETTFPGIDETTTIVDCAAGYGRRTIPLAQKSKAVVALDASLAMLKRLKKHLRTQNGIQVYPLLGSITNIPLRDRSVDIALCSGTIYYFPRRIRKVILEECKRVATRSIIQYRNALNAYNLRQRLLGAKPIEYLTMPNRLTFKLLFWSDTSCEMVSKKR